MGKTGAMFRVSTTGHVVSGDYALCFTCRVFLLVVGAGARQGCALLHFDVAWRVGAGTRVVRGPRERGGGGETRRGERRWTQEGRKIDMAWPPSQVPVFTSSLPALARLTEAVCDRAMLVAQCLSHHVGWAVTRSDSGHVHVHGAASQPQPPAALAPTPDCTQMRIKAYGRTQRWRRTQRCRPTQRCNPVQEVRGSPSGAIRPRWGQTSNAPELTHGGGDGGHVRLDVRLDDWIAVKRARHRSTLQLQWAPQLSACCQPQHLRKGIRQPHRRLWRSKCAGRGGRI